MDYLWLQLLYRNHGLEPSLAADAENASCRLLPSRIVDFLAHLPDNTIQAWRRRWQAARDTEPAQGGAQIDSCAKEFALSVAQRNVSKRVWESVDNDIALQQLDSGPQERQEYLCEHKRQRFCLPDEVVH